MSTRITVRRSLGFMVVAAAINPLSAQAEEPLEEVTVWATKVRASSVALGEEAIAIRQADHLSDLLRTVPGVDVGGAHSLNQRITIRSLGDRNLRVSIDGANQNTYMYHHMGNLQIHSDILQSVDVNVGTNSVVNGGLGGAVRFQTKDARDLLRGEQQFGARLQGTYADNNYHSYTATGYGQLTDNLDALAYYHYLDRSNYEVGGGKIKDTMGNEIAGTDGRVRGLAGELNNVLLKGGWDISDKQRLQFSYESYNDQGDYSFRPDMGLATDLAIAENLGLPLTYDTEFERDTFTLKYELTWGDHSVLDATLYANESELTRDESGIAAVFPGDPSLSKGNAKNRGLNVLGQTQLSGSIDQRLTYGVETIKYETEYRPDDVFVSGEEVQDTALFIEDHIDLGRGFAVIPGLRYNHYDLDANVIEKTYSGFSGSLAGQWAVSDGLLVKLSSTQLFQGPEIAEVFIGAGARDLPNPDIKEQTGLNTELSLAYEGDLGLDGFLSAGFTLFSTQIDDFIYEYAPPPAGSGARFWRDNVGDMELEGLEAYLGYQQGGFKALLTYSQAETELSAANDYAALDGARLDREQGDTVSLNVDYVYAPMDLAFHWDVLWVDDMNADLDLDGPSLDNSKEGFAVHTVSARWTPQTIDGLAVTIGVDNVFDEYYASQSSRTGVSVHPRFGELQLTDYEPGRNVKATVSYQF